MRKVLHGYAISDISEIRLSNPLHIKIHEFRKLEKNKDVHTICIVFLLGFVTFKTF